MENCPKLLKASYNEDLIVTVTVHTHLVEWCNHENLNQALYAHDRR